MASRVPEADKSSQRIPPVCQKLLASFASRGLHELINKRLLNDFDTVGNAARDPQMHERRLARRASTDRKFYTLRVSNIGHVRILMPDEGLICTTSPFQGLSFSSAIAFRWPEIAPTVTRMKTAVRNRNLLINRNSRST